MTTEAAAAAADAADAAAVRDGGDAQTPGAARRADRRASGGRTNARDPQTRDAHAGTAAGRKTIVICSKFRVQSRTGRTTKQMRYDDFKMNNNKRLEKLPTLIFLLNNQRFEQ